MRAGICQAAQVGIFALHWAGEHILTLSSPEQLLDDYYLAFNITSPNTVAIHFRIDAVLLSILATAKKEEANAREHTNPDAESNTESDVEDTLYLDCLVKFSIMRTIKGEQITLAHNVDRILWYGDRDELDTNLIVIRKESPLNTEDYSPLAPMGKSTVLNISPGRIQTIK